MLDLNNLGEGLPGITPNFGEVLAEACGVCLESQGHLAGCLLQVQGDSKNQYILIWPAITDQTKRCWNDDEEATEWGAIGIAILLAKREVGFSVIERSRKGTGFDYWMGDEEVYPFQKKARLEVSGIRNGSISEIKSRVRQKIIQTNRSDGPLPAYIIVVEFSNPIAEVKKK